MEKLTIEQKAMAYDKAIKVANKYKDTNIMFPSIQDEMFPELGESEDADEKVRKALIKLVTNHASMDLFIEYDIHLDEALAWLEKQGDLRVQPQLQSAEWSEEDEINSNICTRLMQTHSLCDKNIITWFNSLKYRIQPQNSSITNEELEQAKKDAYNDALDKIEYHSGEPTFADGWHAAIDCIQKKSFRPNLQWKPSDEQITWLYRAADDASKDSRMKQVLNNLLSDLKKLREE